VVERTFAWLGRFRRLTVRYKCRADIHFAFTTLGCVFVCLNRGPDPLSAWATRHGVIHPPG
jgi:transposase